MMTKGIHTGLYHMDIRRFDYEVAHLYEHLLIQTFIESLQDHGISRLFFGWLGGEAFRDVMFVNYNFYNPDVTKIFEQFINKTGRIDYSLIDNELLRIQAEAVSTVDRVNTEKLIAELKRIDEAQFVNHTKEVVSESISSSDNLTSNIIQLRKAKSQFRHITVMLNAETLTLNEKVAFQRLTPIVYEMIDKQLFQLGSYQNEASFPMDTSEHDGLVAVTIHTIRRRHYTTKYIEGLLKHALSETINDIRRCPEQLKYYLDAFIHSPNWSDGPQYFYRHSGILTSRKNIVEAFTQQTLLSILSKLQVKVSATTQEHWDLVR